MMLEDNLYATSKSSGSKVNVLLFYLIFINYFLL